MPTQRRSRSESPGDGSADESSTAEQSAGESSTAKKTTARKTTAKKTTAKKTTAEGSARRPTTRKTTAARKSAATGSSATASPRTQADRSQGEESRRSARDVAALVAQQLRDLTGRDPESVVSLASEDNGWVVGLEMVESRRIPDSTDILALYEVHADAGGGVRSYERTRRYTRGRMVDD